MSETIAIRPRRLPLRGARSVMVALVSLAGMNIPLSGASGAEMDRVARNVMQTPHEVLEKLKQLVKTN